MSDYQNVRVVHRIDDKGEYLFIAKHADGWIGLFDRNFDLWKNFRERSDDEFLRDAMSRLGGECVIEPPKLGLREFHPRIDRPGTRIWMNRQAMSGDGKPVYSFFELLHLKETVATHTRTLPLFHDLAMAFQHIRPTASNANTHGESLAALLILAATEVESAWKGVLRANGFVGDSGPGYSTRDYVRLLAPMRLDEWELRLAGHPEYGTLSPFKGWDAAAATKSLRWYDDYNSVKHDREGNLPRATLHSVIEAMAAVVILAWAQFGERFVCIDDVPFLARYEAVRRPAFEWHEAYYGDDGADDPSHWSAAKLFAQP